MSILYYNTGSKEMEHLTRNVGMFREMGIRCVPFRYFPQDILFKKVDYLYLNWYENIYKGVFPIAFGMYIMKQFALKVAKIRKIKIVSSQHNRVQHDARYKRMSMSMFRTIYKDSDAIVVFSTSAKQDLKIFLSDDEIKEKAFDIPPINYIGSYPLVKHEWIEKLRFDEELTILFIGNLDRPYKNVRMVIDIAKELENKRIKFIFAGKVSDAEQRTEYSNLIKGAENIVAEFRFIKDDEMAHLLEISDVVIAPYDVESISNSGTARLAFSYGRTVICPMIPSLESTPSELIYTYEYVDKKDHRDKLKNAILNAYRDYCNDKNLFKKKGEMLKSQMEKNNSKEAIIQLYGSLFEKLGGNRI